MRSRLTTAIYSAGLALFVVTGTPAADFQVLEGHGGPIMATAVSPDGEHALTASFDNSVGHWTLANGAVRWLEGHNAAVKTVIFIDDDRAASAGDDYAIEVWDLETGESLHRLEGHEGQVKALAVSADRRLLASASWDGSIGLWDVAGGERVGTFEGHGGPVNDVAFSRDGARLFSASADGTIRIWRVADRSLQRVFVRHGFAVTCLVLNEAAGWLAYGAVDGGTRVVSLSDDRELADLTLERRPILALTASPDFGEIAVGDGEGYIMIVETADWSIRHDFRAALTGPIWALAYSGTGDRLLAGGIEDSAYFWPIGAQEAPIMAGAPREFLRDPATMTNGERQFRRKCSICHSLTGDGDRRAGPTLEGLFGRRAGTVEGYPYSPSIAESDIVWSAETIDKLFDLGPEHYVPGTKMPMQRITRPQDRRDLIDFLKAQTKG